MQQLIGQLGIDWRLLLSQAVNFFLLLIVLRFVAYKPLLKLLHDRRRRIEEGLEKAEEADKRLDEFTKLGLEKVKEAENEAVALLKKTEDESRKLEEKLLAEAKKKEAEAFASTEAALKVKEEESRRAAEKEAAMLVRQAMIKVVELDPDQINDALIAQAVKESRKSIAA